MPRVTAEKTTSPERISYHLRCKPSNPIEIPRCRRSGPASFNSPMDGPMSPDLIFEMSPISPTFPSLSTMYPMPLSPSNKMTEQDLATSPNEPFMYSVPVFRPCPPSSGTWPRSKTARQGVMPSRKLNAIPITAHGRQHRRKEICAAIFDVFDDSAHVPGPDDCGVPRTQSTTKITGFSPINEYQPVCDQPQKPTRRLSPPPRRSSFSSSPWILPGKSDCYEDDVSSSPIDAGALEFRRHLLGRIENKTASRFASFHSCL
ncbi:unnamed protein product [Cyclocybe aegerita]|uniref:Uncharacterized protein n=1 Tax=Cyclocybe aegerita TaxID=1973307 RepID=A0A8S0WGD6_CYCAE|nr:unnamed protein product [Cyclocybe aegerita]